MPKLNGSDSMPDRFAGGRHDPTVLGPPPDPEARLAWATDWLSSSSPADSARRVLTGAQVRAGAVIVAVGIACLLLAPRATLVGAIALLVAGYVATLVLMLYLVFAGGDSHRGIFVSDAEARSAPDFDLPRYTVLVAAYREAQVMGDLTCALARLDYPAHLLEILIVLEADDIETIRAAQAAGIPGARMVIVPPGDPRTKPKALNYALLEATGDLVTVFDAEDRPEPLQLRRAAVALSRDPELACVQAGLGYYNSGQNLLTQWFTLEYRIWFQRFLPGLVRSGAPIPLGGTSNHFRRDVLIEAGAWDPFNVTEDADLGLRLQRRGWRIDVLDSVTLEEANSDFVNWVKQRSRWYKGYLQTWLLNLRDPRGSVKAFGWRGFAFVNLFVGGTPLLALFNPLFWGLTILWFAARPVFIAYLFPAPVFYASLAAWIVGNLLLVYGYLLVGTDPVDDRRPLLGAALTVPLYFVMMSLAAYKAVFQLAFSRSLWEKTTHGLSAGPGPDPSARRPASRSVTAPPDGWSG